MQCGRVGRRLLSMKSLRFRKISEAFLFFLPADLFLLRCFFLHRDFLHRISRMNQKALLLIGLLTDFRGYLAAGQWLAPEMGSCCFCHADFADDADFFSLIILVPQISQIYTDFFFIGYHGIYSEVSCGGDYSRIFAEATCSVVADTP